MTSGSRRESQQKPGDEPSPSNEEDVAVDRKDDEGVEQMKHVRNEQMIQELRGGGISPDDYQFRLFGKDPKPRFFSTARDYLDARSRGLKD